jgi:hypothetical protein
VVDDHERGVMRGDCFLQVKQWSCVVGIALLQPQGRHTGVVGVEQDDEPWMVAGVVSYALDALVVEVQWVALVE